jgi:nitrogen fixation/metabolism regulation signal transduction histidine kinase
VTNHPTPPAPEPETYKRRAIPIIDRRFQFKYTGLIIAVAGTISIVLGILLWRSYRETTEMLEVAMQSQEIAQIVDSADSKFVFSITLLFLVLEVIILGVLGLLITHRVAGPAFVVRRHLASLLEGKFPTMRPLRDGDEFVELFTTLRQLIDSLKQRDAAEVKSLVEVVSALPERERGVVQAMIDERKARLSG